MINTITSVLEGVIRERIGIEVYALRSSDSVGPYLDLIPAGAHRNESFLLRFRLGWRSGEVAFVPGLFSGALIRHMGECDEDGKRIFSVVLSALRAKGLKCSCKVNGAEFDSLSAANWPSHWKTFDLTIRKANQVVDANDIEALSLLCIELVVPMLTMVSALIGMEEQEPNFDGEPEGMLVQSISTRYERKHTNREACILLKGTRCSVCDFDFENVYGELGRRFVEIHHIEQLGTLKMEHEINIMDDLVPLCSNCHSMVHRRNPPLSIMELKEIILVRSQIQGGK